MLRQLSFPTLSHTFRGKESVWSEGCYLSSRGEVWSADSWSGTSFTAVEEAIIEEIRGDGVIGPERSTGLAFSQSVE